MPARTLPLRLALALLLSSTAAGCVLGVDDDGEADGNDGNAMDEGTAGGTEGGECFTPPECDPISPACGDGELCSENLGQFECTPVPEGTELLGEGEACGQTSCAEGLVCVAYCGGGSGCCVPLCDLEEPQCPNDRVCSPFYSPGSTQCYAHVGVCEPE